MKANGRQAEAHLGRGADGAGGMAVARVGRKPWGARGLLDTVGIGGGMRARETRAKVK